MKKFYKSVSVEPAGDAFAVALDGRPIKTPAKAAVHVPTSALAEALAVEWRAQGEDIVPDTMPYTQLVSTALDRVNPRRGEVIAELVAFGDTDLLCYRDGSDAKVLQRQQQAWDPVLDAFTKRHGVAMQVTEGVMPVQQARELRPRLIDIVQKFDSFTLTAFHTCVSGFGSIILALAVFEGELDLDSAWSLSVLEQTVQEEQWGTDSEVEEKRNRLLAEIRASLDLKHLLSV